MGSPWTDRRLLHMASLSLAGSLPLAIVWNTIPAWLADANLSVETIGIFSLAGLPWTLKFLWSPLMDRFSIPFAGRRKGWIVTAQILLALSIAALGFIRVHEAQFVVAAGLLIAFFSASQDIAMDAYAVDLMEEEEHGPGNALRTTFYRLGMLAAGGAAIAMADQMSWRLVYFSLAGVMLLFVPITYSAPSLPAETTVPSSLKEAVLYPLQSFAAHPHAGSIAAFILLYKFGDNMAASMLPPFFIQELSVSKTEFGLLQKTVGLVATIGGTLFGGALIPKLGLGRALWVFGALQASANLLYAVTAWTDGLRPVMYAALAIEQSCGGMGIAGLLVLITRLCDTKMSATQFALLTSLFGLGRTLAGPLSGPLVKHLGYGLFFVSTFLAAVPALFFLSRFGEPEIHCRQAKPIPRTGSP